MTATTRQQSVLLPEAGQLCTIVRLLHGEGCTDWQPLSSITSSLQPFTPVGAPAFDSADPLLQRLIDDGVLRRKGRGNSAMVRLDRTAADYLDSSQYGSVADEIRREGYGGSLAEELAIVLPRERRPAPGILGVLQTVLFALSPLLKVFIVTAPITAVVLRTLVPRTEQPLALLMQTSPELRPLLTLLPGVDEFAFHGLLLVWVLCAVFFFLYRNLLPPREKAYCVEYHMPLWWHVKVPGVGLLVWAVAPAGLWAAFLAFVFAGSVAISAIEARRY